MGCIVHGEKSACAQWNRKVSALQLVLSSSHTWSPWAVERVGVIETGDRGPLLQAKDEPPRSAGNASADGILYGGPR